MQALVAIKLLWCPAWHKPTLPQLGLRKKLHTDMFHAHPMPYPTQHVKGQLMRKKHLATNLADNCSMAGLFFHFPAAVCPSRFAA